MNRREFLKSGLHASAGLILIRYLDFAYANNTGLNLNPGYAFAAHDSNGKILSQRYEGPIKVTGGKIYGIDFHASDLAGWPAIERRSVILRTSIANKMFFGINKNKIIHDLGVARIVTGDDIAQWGCKAGAPFLMPEFYVPSKTVPFYFGQPLA